MSAVSPNEEDLFDAARQLTDPTERRSYLELACNGDAALRARVEELLTAAAAAEPFFEKTGSALDWSGAFGLVQEMARPAEPLHTLGEEPVGTRIGRYKLIKKIGEGGCGVVYLAEQEEPVRRLVALKIIKLGMETKRVIARFEAERQALALMDHPNIARVFDAGATDRGPPYFVMELVDGIRITEYCDRHRLDIPRRLDLFIQICHAIQHAHQKGIIHGDIKPSNILVTLQDDEPVPKVIDFGISRATESRLSDKSLFTLYAQLIGTPAYMSPEQAEWTSAGIDTRSDIYSLGALLYELLTGRPPFDPKQLLDAGLDEMRRVLREKEPPRPSARVQALELVEAQATAARRQTESPRLISLLRGDLDWVVMRALEKDRRRRYETANGLAMDVRRHLNHDPVEARPASWAYRFGKLVRRNRVVFIAGAAVALALLAGMGTSTWLFLRERDARQRAVAAEQQQVRLRHEAEVREKVAQAALLVSLERFEEADALLQGLTLTQPTVEGAAVYRATGEWHALHQRWQQAADRFDVLLHINQRDGTDVATLDYLERGPALIEAGDLAGYERFRQDAIARFSDSAAAVADRIIKISLLVPASPALLDRLRPLAEDTAAAIAEADTRGQAFEAAWRSLSLALFEFRAGNLPAAISWSQRCLAYPDSNAPRSATARVVLAMALQQAGQPEQARAELELGQEIIETKFRSRLDRGTPVQGFWFDWAFARILAREAAEPLTAPGGAPRAPRG